MTTKNVPFYLRYVQERPRVGAAIVGLAMCLLLPLDLVSRLLYSARTDCKDWYRDVKGEFKQLVRIWKTRSYHGV